jgi:hypothetical protein
MSLLSHVDVLDAVALRSFLADEVPTQQPYAFLSLRRIRAAEQQNLFFDAFLCAACCLAFLFAHACRGVRWRYVRWRYPAVLVRADPPAADSAGIVPVLGFVFCGAESVFALMLSKIFRFSLTFETSSHCRGFCGQS